ncbi:RNase P/RNase MRP complex subunit [Modicella reniformis]|uniref:Ribonuclease P protein subunit p29 n=1 Tax=Modicella reniformis TaxID=1440133 RepID=A0A9P6ST45_9FUNG|nr:RNase P/RNase MRP complex subunit [Modicella reniformis]
MDSQDRSDLNLYSRLSADTQKSAGLESNSVGVSATTATAEAQVFVPNYVENAVVKEYDAESSYNSKVKNRVILLDNPTKDLTEAKERQKKRKRANKSKALTAKEKRALDVYNIPIESRKYELFLPLHELWKGYMEELFGSTNPIAFTQKLLKADFHGAIITVVRSKCPTYVGITGIIAQETENVFKIITPSNALQVIPKANNVFTVPIRNSLFTVHGNQFRYRASQRSSKKFKSKPTVDL